MELPLRRLPPVSTHRLLLCLLWESHLQKCLEGRRKLSSLLEEG